MEMGAAGAPVERWEGLQLRVVGAAGRKVPWVTALLGPYLERKVREIVPGAAISIAMRRNGDSRQAIEQALGFRAVLGKRPDGKPEESLLIQKIVSGQMPPPKLLGVDTHAPAEVRQVGRSRNPTAGPPWRPGVASPEVAQAAIGPDVG